MAVRVWTCANEHTFVFGGESWHHETNQGFLEDGAPIPMFCTEFYDDGEPCLDSSSLIYE